ncbi:MAG: hypothetical protein O2887_07905 [Bacteroidetes bacterium]|nr:hypothetical protein [Bacteroidota bacterium]
MKTKQLKSLTTGSRLITFAIVIPMLYSCAPRPKMTSPFNDAAALWAMRDLQSASENDVGLVPQGKVEVGVKLKEEEIQASEARGGDGYAARFDGGYFLTGGAGLQLTGQEMTLLMRVKDEDEKWESPLFARHDQDNKFSQIIYGTGKKLNYLWQTETGDKRLKKEDGKIIGQQRHSQKFMDGVLDLSIRTENIENNGWHDIIIRFAGPNLELFVDGVLVDEEWPHGNLFKFQGPFLIGAELSERETKSGFIGMIDHVALWDRALSQEEITKLSGGGDMVAKRDLEILGPKEINIQYWKPRGQAFAGDCLPYYHDGIFHMIYLFDRRHHGSKWGKGAHQFAHLSSKDLVNWEEHPKAVPILKQWENSMGTCNITYNHKDNKYYAFYTDCGSRAEYIDKPYIGNQVFTSVSEDGINYTKDFNSLLAGHDVEVFFDKKSDYFYLIRRGVELLKSLDLITWEDAKLNLVELPEGTSDECPDHFEWNGWYYFILGRNALWKSPKALGPWERIDPNIYDGLMVPKVSEYADNRRILAGFVDFPGWGGNIAMRELIQFDDGSLGMKWPIEVIPESGYPLEFGVELLSGGASASGKSISLNAKGNLETAVVYRLPQDLHIIMTVNARDARNFGLSFRGSGKTYSGRELRFEPGRERVQFGEPQDGDLAAESNDPRWEAYNLNIENVKGLDKQFELQVIVKEKIIDVVINNQRTIINRLRGHHDGDNLFFFAKNGSVSFDDIEIRPLTVKEYPFVY